MNTSNRSSLLCLEFKSIAIGYRALQIVSSLNEIKVLEASPAGDRFLILATGEVPTLEAARNGARDAVETEQLLDSEIVADCAPGLLDALYHLPQTQADEAVLIAECASVSGLISVAQALLNTVGLKVIELKIKRSGGGAYGFFTGTSVVCAPGAEEARTKLKRVLRVGQIEVVEDLSPAFRRYFNIDGQE